jgi:adenosylcobinamide-GDP ribazoletransferase
VTSVGRSLGAAFGFLTIVPVGRRWDEGQPPDAVGWYPSVGLFLGCLGCLVAWGVSLVGSERSGLLGGALLIGTWAIATRMLHWDGLADAADGLMGSFEPERRLEIMRDSRVGAFGATAVVLVVAMQVASAGVLLDAGTYWPILVAPVTARAAISLACWTLPAARREGLGLSAVGPPSLSGRLAAVLALGVALAVVVWETLVSGAWTLVASAIVLVVGDVAALAVPRWLARGVGGVTGDILGASAVLVETTVLVAAALAVAT